MRKINEWAEAFWFRGCSEATELLRKYPLSQGLGGRQLGAGGRVTGIMDTLIGKENDEDALVGRMRDGSNRYWQAAVIEQVLPFLEQMSLEHAPSIEDLFDFVAPKPFVAPDRETMFALGLRAGYYGDWFESVHILVPQVENALRWLLESTGEIVYGQYASGIQDYMKFEQVLAHARTAQILGEDVVFDIAGLLTDRLGANLRNRLAHGLLEWTSGDVNHAVYLWWLVLHFAVQTSLCGWAASTRTCSRKRRSSVVTSSDGVTLEESHQRALHGPVTFLAPSVVLDAKERSQRRPF